MVELELFHVTVSGKGFRLVIEGEDNNNSGFIKNEYVISSTGTEACQRAIDQVRRRIIERQTNGGIVIKNLDIWVDNVEKSFKFWKLINQEGFIFYKEE